MPLKRLTNPETPPAPARRKVQRPRGHEAECTLAVVVGDLGTTLEVSRASAGKDSIAIKARGTAMAAAPLGLANHVMAMTCAVQGTLREQKCEISTEALRCLVGRVEWLWRGMQQPLAIVAEGVGAHVALAAWLTLAADFDGALAEEILQARARIVASEGKMHQARAIAMLQQSRAMALMQVSHTAAPHVKV